MKSEIKNLSSLLSVYATDQKCIKIGSEIKLHPFFKIFLARGSLISLCLGTASIVPFLGFIQIE